MASYIARRFIQTLIVVVLVTFVVFIVLHSIPGNPILMYLGPNATTQQIQHYTKLYGLDQPLLVQYFKWLGNLSTGQFGYSIAFSQNIGPLLWSKLRVTLYLTMPAFVLSISFGVLLGIIAAVRRGKAIDSLITVFANLGMATPVFWLAILCVYVFSLKLGWLPVQGFTWPSQNFWLSIREMVMPVSMLALVPLGVFARQARSSMLEVIRQDFVRTARSKGVRERAVTYVHVLRNALIPIVTLMGVQFGYMIGGSVLIERVYDIPGMGNMLITAILHRDYELVQSMVFVIAAAVSVSNLAVDIAYGFIDPRIRVTS